MSRTWKGPRTFQKISFNSIVLGLKIKANFFRMIKNIDNEIVIRNLTVFTVITKRSTPAITHILLGIYRDACCTILTGISYTTVVGVVIIMQFCTGRKHTHKAMVT